MVAVSSLFTAIRLCNDDHGPRYCQSSGFGGLFGLRSAAAEAYNNKMYNKGHVLPADGQLRTCEQSHALIQHIVTFVL